MQKFYAIFLGICLFVLTLFSGYRYGIHHAMTDSWVAVYLNGIVEIHLDGEVYEHEAF